MSSVQVQQETTEVEHEPIPVWHDRTDGHRYCVRYSVHGDWVHWPCEDAQ